MLTKEQYSKIQAMNMKKIIFLTLLSICISSSYAQETWRLAKNKNKIKVYVSEIDGSNYYAFKAMMSVKASKAQIITILKEVHKYPEWFAFTASAQLISKGTNEQVFFMETDYPWPYSNECMNYSMKFLKSQDDNLKVTITGTNKRTNCAYSLKKAKGYILLEPDKEYTQISYYLHCEPSQNILTWLINPNIHEMPYQTFVALKKKLDSLSH